MCDGDKNEELKNELNGTIGSGETAGEEAAAGNITGGAADKAPGGAADKAPSGAADKAPSGAAIGETAGQTVLSGAENKGEPLRKLRRRPETQRSAPAFSTEAERFSVRRLRTRNFQKAVFAR